MCIRDRYLGDNSSPNILYPYLISSFTYDVPNFFGTQSTAIIRSPQRTVSGVSNIKMWYDASDPLNTGTNPTTLLNQPVTTWYDKTQYNIINAIQNSNVNPINLNNDSSGYYLNYNTNSYNIGSGLSWIYNNNFTIFIVETPKTAGKGLHIAVLLLDSAKNVI